MPAELTNCAPSGPSDQRSRAHSAGYKTLSTPNLASFVFLCPSTSPLERYDESVLPHNIEVEEHHGGLEGDEPDRITTTSRFNT